jgi:hypothetical protein
MPNQADANLWAFIRTRDSIFTLEQARACGLTDKEIEARSGYSFLRFYRGVFVLAGAALTARGALRAACLAGDPLAAVSHRSAAAFYDVPGGRKDLAELTCPRWLRTTQSGLLVHESTRINPGDVTLIDELPVMRPERVLLELAGIYRSPDFIEKVAQAMRRKRLITYESTLSTFNRLARKGVRGVKVMRTVLERWDPTQRPTESEMETLVLQILREAGFADLVPQFEVFDKYGRFVARVDIGLPRWRIGVEYDSMQEHSDEFARARDNRRRNALIRAEWIPVVARYHDIRNGGEELISTLREKIRALSA